MSISQAEARRLKRRVKELEEQNLTRFARYRRCYPGGVHALSFTMSEATLAALNMASKLGCALVAKISGQQLDIFAVLNDGEAL